MGSGCSSQGVPVGDPEHVAVALVEADPVRHAAVGAAAALEPAVDDVGDHAVTGRAPAGRPVRGRGAPTAP